MRYKNEICLSFDMKLLKSKNKEGKKYQFCSRSKIFKKILQPITLCPKDFVAHVKTKCLGM